MCVPLYHVIAQLVLLFGCTAVESFVLRPTTPLIHFSSVSQATVGTAMMKSSADEGPTGLYRPFINHAWKTLGPLLSPVLPSSFEFETTKSAVAKGMPEGTVVNISTGAMKGTITNNRIKYARFALLETVLPGLQETTSGIQVLNLIIFPQGDLPVWGVDLVSLPGDKHLLAIDVQPMASSSDLPHAHLWKMWHAKHVDTVFEWGGDFPEAAAKYFSPYCLWTRLNGPKGIYQIQNEVMEAFQEHLGLYLDMVMDTTVAFNAGDHYQNDYLNYRLANDPARPMLKSLYGPEWTERLLTEMLFPKPVESSDER